MSNTTTLAYKASDIFKPNCLALRQAWFHDAEIESLDSHSIRWADGFEIGFAYSDDTGSYGGYFAYVPDPLDPYSHHFFELADIEFALELKQTNFSPAYKALSTLKIVSLVDAVRRGKAA